MFISTCRSSIEKPFNPILGETYQGSIEGVPIFLEQICHHPPITAYYLSDKNFTIWGNVELILDMGLNTVYSRVPCWMHAKIPSTKTEYIVRLPEVELGGLLYGDRTLKLHNKGYIL